MYTNFMPVAYMYNPYPIYPNPYYMNPNPYLVPQVQQKIYVPGPEESILPPDIDDYYSATRNIEDGTVKITYDIPNACDEERIYIFKADGSASSESCAWGGKKEYPAGTFSKLMKNLPKELKMDPQLARQMVNELHKKENGKYINTVV